eukprot:scaffold135878_cov13-Tisochrysis_lutea.AAC.1
MGGWFAGLQSPNCALTTGFGLLEAGMEGQRKSWACSGLGKGAMVRDQLCGLISQLPPSVLF